MSNVVIVAIPKQDDYTWKISSEEVPHMTLCFLSGDAPVMPIFEFVQHAVDTMKLGPFGLDVDFRGVLGPDEADVLFFRKDWSLKRINQFREVLLKEPNIKKGYDAVTQYPMWTPHLTLGYPETPAKPDNRDYPGISWVEFDKIAVWDGNFSGPEIQLEHNFDDDMEVMAMSMEAGEAFIRHHGVKGQKWGVRKKRGPVGRAAVSTLKVADNVLFVTGTQSQTVHNGIQRRAHKAFKQNELPALKKKHGKAAKLIKNPLSAEAAAYRKDAKAAYVKQLEIAANNTRNFQGNLQYTMKKEGGKPNTRKYYWALHVKQVKHAATDTGDFDFRVHPVFDADGFIVDIEDTASMAQDAVDKGEEFISHFGVKGMKWGVHRSSRGRRPQPAHVPVTAESVVRRGRLTKTSVKTSGGEKHAATDDAIAAAVVKQKLKKSGHKALTNQELQLLSNRLQLETQVQQLIQRAPKTPVEALAAQVKKDPVGSAKTAVKVGKDVQKLHKRATTGRR
jgi:hypothetical protein